MLLARKRSTVETARHNEFAMHAFNAKSDVHVYGKNTVPDAVRRGHESAWHVRNYPLSVLTTVSLNILSLS